MKASAGNKNTAHSTRGDVAALGILTAGIHMQPLVGDAGRGQVRVRPLRGGPRSRSVVESEANEDGQAAESTWYKKLVLCF